MCARLMHRQTKEGKKERSKEGIRRVKCKIFNPPSINQLCRDGIQLALYISGRWGWEWRGQTVGGGSFHAVALESSSAFSSMMSSPFHSHFTFTSICSLAPSFQGFLHLTRTCLHVLHLHLHVCRIAIYDASCWINLEVPNCFEVSSKRMQPARLLRGQKCFTAEEKKKLQQQKSAVTSSFLGVFF